MTSHSNADRCDSQSLTLPSLVASGHIATCRAACVLPGDESSDSEFLCRTARQRRQHVSNPHPAGCADAYHHCSKHTDTQREKVLGQSVSLFLLRALHVVAQTQTFITELVHVINNMQVKHSRAGNIRIPCRCSFLLEWSDFIFTDTKTLPVLRGGGLQTSYNRGYTIKGRDDVRGWAGSHCEDVLLGPLTMSQWELTHLLSTVRTSTKVLHGIKTEHNLTSSSVYSRFSADMDGHTQSEAAPRHH